MPSWPSLAEAAVTFCSDPQINALGRVFVETIDRVEEVPALRELSEVELAIVGGGCGDVLF